MAIDYTMPKLAMAMNEGTINEWLVAEGDYVEKGQVLATVETEKVSYDVESPAAGYFHIVVPVGETVDCEMLLGQFAESEDELASLQAQPGVATAAEPASAAGQTTNAMSPVAIPAAIPATNQPGGRIKVSPFARKLAADKGLDLSALAGTGPRGRIVKRDVLAAIESRSRLAAAPGGAALVAERVLARVPMQGMRKTIASRMVQSLQETAQLSSNWESDITDLLVMRKSFLAREEALGTRVSFNAFLIKAMVYAIRQVPIANSCLQGDEIVIYDNVNMGMAVSIPGTTEYDSGLVVAVLRNVESMGVASIDKAMKALIERVRSGSATAEDMTGATITLSSTAGIGPPGLTSTPVLNLPNAALLGPSTPTERPVVHQGEVKVRTMLPLSFTFDHRMLDGEPAARFMSVLHDCLQHPELMLS